jgi:imidazolonepropionase-like amidohydrolase
MRSVPPPELLSRLAERGIAISATLGYTSPPPDPPVWMAAVPIMRSAFADIHREGGVVVVGTDAGINLGKPHDVLPYAHQILLDDVGMAPVEALRAMTSVAADVCGRPELGRLRAGSPADLVAVADDPSVSSTALIEPIAVWKDGRSVRDDR